MNITKETITFENSGEMFPALQGGNPKYLYCNDFKLSGDMEELLELYNRGREDEDFFEVTEDDCILLTVYMDITGKIVADISSDYDSRELKLNENEKEILLKAVQENYMDEHGTSIENLKEDFYKEMEKDYFNEKYQLTDEDFSRYANKIATQFGISEENEAKLAEHLKNAVEFPFVNLSAYDLVKSYENELIPFSEYATFGNVTESLYNEIYTFCKNYDREAISEVDLCEDVEYDENGISGDFDVPF